MQKLLLLMTLSLLSACQCLNVSNVGIEEQNDDFFRGLVETRYVEPFKAGDVDRWIAAFDDKAIGLHNTRPADKGKSAIEAFGRAVHQHFRLETYDVKVTDIRRSEQWVYTVGEYTTLFVNKSDGKAPWGLSKGKFVLLWELDQDGEWRIILDMGNSNQR